MVKAIKDISRLGVAFLKICLFFLPIIALISSMMGVVGMMMNMEDPALEMGFGPASGDELVVPVNYSITNPTNFDMKDYQILLNNF